MTNAFLSAGSGLIAFGPVVSLFSLIIYQKAQLVIVVTTAAFFFLLAATIASVFWFIFDATGLNGPLAAMIPGVLAQFFARCSFVALYHRVEKVIQISLDKQHAQEVEQAMANAATPTIRGGGGGGGRSVSASAAVRTNATTAGAATAAEHHSASSSDGGGATEESIAADRQRDKNTWTEAARLRLELNDAASGVAAGVGFGGMHAILLYGTLLASEMSNNVGVLYQDSCPKVPSLTVSACYSFFFSILDLFWMLFTFFGMRRRLLFPRGARIGVEDGVSRAIGGYFGNTRTGGNIALLLTLITHFIAALLTTADYFPFGCYVALPGLLVTVLVVAYLFWAGVGRIYMPPMHIPGSLLNRGANGSAVGSPLSASAGAVGVAPSSDSDSFHRD